MLLYAHTNRTFITQLEVQDQLMNNAYSGVAYVNGNYKEFKPYELKKIRLFNEGIDSVELSLEPWGMFSIIKSKAIHGRYSFEKIALNGTKAEAGLSLFIADLGRPIALGGNTRLEGDCYLPKSGLKRAYINGQNYIGAQMIYGRKFESKPSLPGIEPDFFQQKFGVKGNFKTWENNDSLVQSFANPADHYVSDNVLALDGNFVKGHVILEAKDSIFVAANCELSQVILKAPIVHFERGFEGDVQVLASKKIRLEEEVILKYPSVLVCVEVDYPNDSQNGIEIGENAQVLGGIIAHSETPNFRRPVYLKLDHGTNVCGLVYSSGIGELKGECNGSVYLKKLYLKTTSSEYENHLLNATIKNELPAEFIIPEVFNLNKKLTTITWLN